MLGLLMLLALGLALYWSALVVWVAHRLTRPARRSYAWAVAYGQPGDPSELDAPREFEALEARDGRHTLAYWSIAGDDPSGPVVVFAHGWGESKQAALVRIEGYAPIASRIIAWDLPGHGESTARSCALGAREPYSLLHLLKAIAPAESVVLAGFSLGAGVSIVGGALQARAEERAARVIGVIAEAPYRVPWTPAAEVLRQFGVPPGPVLAPALCCIGLGVGAGPRWRRFDRAEHAREIGCPLLVLHGTNDVMCPPDDGRSIAGATPNGRFVPIEGVGHLDMWAYAGSRMKAAAAVRDFVGGLRRPEALIAAGTENTPESRVS